MNLDWNVQATLARVDWSGRMLEMVGRARQHVGRLSRRHGKGIRFSVSARPGAYRLTILFRNRSAQKLGGYGFYVRVVPPTRKTRLGVNTNSYQPGSTVFARVENLGTKSARYGAAYAIERFDGSTWVRAPESPSVFIRPLWAAGPGRTGVEGCSRFQVPTSMQPGRYRISKQVEYAIRKSKDAHPTSISAEFDIGG